MNVLTEEEWKTIEEFPIYEISNLGRIRNVVIDKEMKHSKTQFGHHKITLYDEWNDKRYTRSVALLVAQAFCEVPDHRCNRVIMLDGDLDNVVASNIAWRPGWFVWKYSRQFKEPQPLNFQNLPVVEMITDTRYENIMEAGIALGMLWQDIWMSCLNGYSYIPNKYVFRMEHESQEDYLRRV